MVFGGKKKQPILYHQESHKLMHSVSLFHCSSPAQDLLVVSLQRQTVGSFLSQQVRALGKIRSLKIKLGVENCNSFLNQSLEAFFLYCLLGKMAFLKDIKH